MCGKLCIEQHIEAAAASCGDDEEERKDICRFFAVQQRFGGDGGVRCFIASTSAAPVPPPTGWDATTGVLCGCGEQFTAGEMPTIPPPDKADLIEIWQHLDDDNDEEDADVNTSYSQPSPTTPTSRNPIVTSSPPATSFSPSEPTRSPPTSSPSVSSKPSFPSDDHSSAPPVHPTNDVFLSASTTTPPPDPPRNSEQTNNVSTALTSLPPPPPPSTQQEVELQYPFELLNGEGSPSWIMKNPSNFGATLLSVKLVNLEYSRLDLERANNLAAQFVKYVSRDFGVARDAVNIYRFSKGSIVVDFDITGREVSYLAKVLNTMIYHNAGSLGILYALDKDHPRSRPRLLLQHEKRSDDVLSAITAQGAAFQAEEKVDLDRVRDCESGDPFCDTEDVDDGTSVGSEKQEGTAGKSPDSGNATESFERAKSNGGASAMLASLNEAFSKPLLTICLSIAGCVSFVILGLLGWHMYTRRRIQKQHPPEGPSRLDSSLKETNHSVNLGRANSNLSVATFAGVEAKFAAQKSEGLQMGSCEGDALAKSHGSESLASISEELIHGLVK